MGNAGASAAGRKDTPMMQQWAEYRRKLPGDTLLLFRLGDFYEMFYEDAVEGARLFGITQTRRQDVPMAGIPFHAADSYIPRLLAAGKKVALCDQVETPRPANRVQRRLTRILTPGTTLEDAQLDARRNHYLLALDCDKHGLHAAWLDLSTGDFACASENDPASLLPVLDALDPRELLVPENASEHWSHPPRHGRTPDGPPGAFAEGFHLLAGQRPLTRLPDYHFEPRGGARAVAEALGVLNLDGFGLPREHPGLGPAGALVHYATETLCESPRNLRRIRPYTTRQALLLDPTTQRNLEIFRNSRGQRSGSLLEALDHTCTAAGARLLEALLAAPLLDLEELNRRQQCIGELIDAPGPCARLQDRLRATRDLARILGRLQNRIRNPRELGAIRDTLAQLPPIKSELAAAFPGPRTTALNARIGGFDALREFLAGALNDDLPGKLDEGGIIREGYDAELDRLRGLTRDNKTWIAELERSEQDATGIKNLKVKYNGAFGYFIEVTKANLSLVPGHYVRKQTMTNAERYYTPELKEKEKEILHAEENALAREESLFHDILARVLEDSAELARTAEALAELDLFLGWTQLARQWDYCRPELADDGHLEIEQGRHPVVEQTLHTARPGGTGGHQAFVPNDTLLTNDAEQIALITGPNMAGKSTYIRQVALITLIAQIGSWVPARRARIGLADRIFSRVGASDELARGNSTFMVEMNETANILNNATPRSLVILDEVGRGTATYDGLSIAWAVVEHLHQDPAHGPRTLFATHYHELTRLEATLPRLRNYAVAVKEWNDEIIFVRQVVPGAADRSYGIQVARLAGLPPAVISRAQAILEELETEGNLLQAHLARSRGRKGQNRPPAAGEDPPGSPQLDLF